MADKKKSTLNVDLSCKSTQASDTLTKDGERTTFTGTYKGVLNVGEKAVTVELKIKSDDKDALEECVPLVVGATRNLKLFLTDEDLDNHQETKQT
jgi:hypothetical protein